MKTDLELLDNYYNLMKGKTENREFLLTFLDYMNFLDSKKLFRDYLIQELKTRRTLQDQIVSIESDAVEEIRKNLQDIKKIIEEIKSENIYLPKKVEEISKIVESRTSGNDSSFLENAEQQFEWLLREINVKDPKGKVKVYVKNVTEYSVSLSEEKFPKLSRYTRLIFWFRRRQFTETWGVVFNALALYNGMHTTRNWSKELQEEFKLHRNMPSDKGEVGDRFWSGALYGIIKGEKKYKSVVATPFGSAYGDEEKDVTYDKEKFNAERLHNFLLVFISNINENSNKNTKPKNPKTISEIIYNEETCLLNIVQGDKTKSVKLQGKTQRDILINCFGKDFALHRMYNFEDVLEISYFVSEMYNKESLEKALRRINEKVEKEVGIIDLISINQFNFFINKGLL